MLILKRHAMYVYRKIEERSRSHWYHGKGISVNLYVCIHPLVILHTKHMCCTILSSVACLALLYFSTLTYNGTIFEKILNIKYIYILIFSTMLLWNISPSKTKSARRSHKSMYIFRYSTVEYSTVLYCTVLYPLFLWGLNKLEFSRQIFEKSFKH